MCGENFGQIMRKSADHQVRVMSHREPVFWDNGAPCAIYANIPFRLLSYEPKHPDSDVLPARRLGCDRREQPMTRIKSALLSFLRNEDGPTAVEYAVMLALIIVVCITAITALGSNANNTFSYVATQVGSTGGS
jgi:pilus assembly protein Flp/PilA